MLTLFTVFLSVSYALSDVWQYDYMPQDNTSNSKQLGICYGQNTQWRQNSAVVAYRYNNGGACCTGSLISLNPGIVLTAKHCNCGYISVGCDNPQNCAGADSYYPSASRNPPNSMCAGGANNGCDIKVLLFNEAITTSGASTKSIPSSTEPKGNAAVVGYGITQTGSTPSSLQSGSMSIIGNTECNNIMKAALGGSSDYIDQTMICARAGSAESDGSNTATCSGDSGGPWGGSSQIGITSWGLQGSGPGCNNQCNCCTGYPSVAVNVGYFKSWIDETITEWTAKYKVDLNATTI